MGKLIAAKVKTLSKPGMYGDGGGLYLQVRGSEQRSWIYRYKVRGRGHLMGLGALADVSLAQARDAADAARKLVRQGEDPIKKRQTERVRAARDELNTFGEVADAYIREREGSWRNGKHRQQWRNTLSNEAIPSLRAVPVAKVDVHDVMQVLNPIWSVTPETASRVQGRIKSILNYAKARGLRSGDNPAEWRGHLENMLTHRSKVARVRHHAALPWTEISTFMSNLNKQEGTAALALRFTILTAARTGEVIGACWGEIDMVTAIWTIPSNRMKAGREHRVPLSDRAMEILHLAARLRSTTHSKVPVFPGGQPGKGLSNMAMSYGGI